MFAPCFVLRVAYRSCLISGRFLAALAVDLVPVVGPPALTVMVLLQVTFALNPWLVLGAGVPGSVPGRYVLSLYAPWLSKKIITQRKTDDLEFVGRKLKQKLGQSWTFVFLYSVSPLPTTPLFRPPAWPN